MVIKKAYRRNRLLKNKTKKFAISHIETHCTATVVGIELVQEYTFLKQMKICKWDQVNKRTQYIMKRIF